MGHFETVQWMAHFRCERQEVALPLRCSNEVRHRENGHVDQLIRRFGGDSSSYLRPLFFPNLW